MFLKADQDAKAKEREEDKEVRAKERKEDMDHILDMIASGVKKEVMAAIQPLEERLELQEKVNKELYTQVDALMKEVELMKERGNQQQEAFPVLPQPQVQQVQHQEDERMQWAANRIGDREHLIRRSEDEHSVTMKNLCASARRVIGFSPIEPRMLDIQVESYGAKDIEEAKWMEVKSYLKCEMKLLPSVINRLNIVRIFPPAKQDWNVLYVEFASDHDVDTIFSYTKNMIKKDHRVIRWIPKQMYERYRAVEGLAYKLRQEQGLKTRVKIGVTDLVLSTRDPKLTVWSNYILPDNLPEIHLEQLPSSSVQTRMNPQDNSSRRTSI